ncbi:MAG: Ni/Fe hydrogenase subunit alpha [bacterium]|nr:Ni/Fe hydrogenase subunit alpha [bacterium]
MNTTKRIEINPVTRVEGHGRILIELDDDGKVSDTIFSVSEFRGFEKFCEGRMIWDMPTITDRICGVCPVSHHLASVKACEALLGAEPPPPANILRELLHMGQFIHSHALSFFFFALPDFAVKENTSANSRSFLGFLDNNKELARSAVLIRKAGQDIVDIVGGGRLHPISCIPGGMSKYLQYIDRINMLKGLITALPIARNGVKMAKGLYEKHKETFDNFASFPSLYMGMVKDDNLELYDGKIRIVDSAGNTMEEFKGKDYLDHIEEVTTPTSWTKCTYYKRMGYPEGSFRVAPLARLNIAGSISTPEAGAELKEFKKLGAGSPLEASLFYHYARMIELLYAVERAKELLNNPDILSHEVRVPVKRCGGEGVGVIEAPRGTLFHHYKANEDGRLTKVNFIVSTAHNNEAMNRSVRAVAEKVVKDGEIQEGDRNKLEIAIRCYDPCLSCSTHDFGRMPLEVTIQSSDGEVLSQFQHGDM